jgi:hypothetical protein
MREVPYMGNLRVNQTDACVLESDLRKRDGIDDGSLVT